MNQDINDYIGIPWVQGGSTREGADCWGLVLLVSREVFGLDLGLYEGAKHTGEDLARIIEGEERSPRWARTLGPRAGDVATIRNRGDKHPSHVGINIGDGKILHSLDTSAHGASAVHKLTTMCRMFGAIEHYRYADNNHTA